MRLRCDCDCIHCIHCSEWSVCRSAKGLILFDCLIAMAATAPTPSSPLGCDRRLSRAARSILVRGVLPILRHHSASKRGSAVKRKRPTSIGGTAEPEDATELWEVLLEHLDSNGGGADNDGASQKAAACLLDPRNDLFRYHEASSHGARQSGTQRQPNTAQSIQGRQDSIHVRHMRQDIPHSLLLGQSHGQQTQRELREIREQ